MSQRFVRTIVTVALLGMSVTVAHAARQWQHLGRDDTGTHYLYDKKTTRRQGDIVSGWVSKQYGVDEPAMKEKNRPLTQYEGETWTLGFYEFDCKQNRLRVLTGKEKLSGDRVQDVTREEYRAAAPNSLDEAILKAICKEVQ